jgi:hypothetical protein
MKSLFLLQSSKAQWKRQPVCCGSMPNEITSAKYCCQDNGNDDKKREDVKNQEEEERAYIVNIDFEFSWPASSCISILHDNHPECCVLAY